MKAYKSIALIGLIFYSIKTVVWFIDTIFMGNEQWNGYGEMLMWLAIFIILTIKVFKRNKQ